MQIQLLSNEKKKTQGIVSVKIMSNERKKKIPGKSQDFLWDCLMYIFPIEKTHEIYTKKIHRNFYIFKYQKTFFKL